METLSADEILQIHEQLVGEFADSPDPIFPAGVKSDAMLESAVGRQDTGFGDYTKYSSIEAAAATLFYGLTCNHAFHNGNKRTALVSMLSFLDKNGRTLAEVSHDELFKLVTRVASHTLVDGQRKSPDAEVEEIRLWIRKRSRPQESGEKVITYRQLRRILSRYGYTLETPMGNFIDVCRDVKRRTLLGRVSSARERVMHIPYPGENVEVGKRLLKSIRRTLGLTEEQGYDSRTFYDDQMVVDSFISRYQPLLRRLAKA